jgi:hypothetical protein
MARRILVSGLLVALALTVSSTSRGGDKSAPALRTPPANANFEKLKKLAGTWVLADEQGRPTDQIWSVIKVTAGGSAVHETTFPGQDQEMISVYTVDGSDLVMTHYCVLGNQPRMKADPASKPNQIVFHFAGGGNLDPAKDKHAHEATLTFINDDQYEVNGVAWENGAPAKDMCGAVKLVRKK